MRMAGMQMPVSVCVWVCGHVSVRVYYYNDVSHVLQTSWGTLMLFIVTLWLNTYMCNYLKIKFHIKWNNVIHYTLRLSFMLKELWEHLELRNYCMYIIFMFNVKIMCSWLAINLIASHTILLKNTWFCTKLYYFVRKIL